MLVAVEKAVQEDRLEMCVVLQTGQCLVVVVLLVLFSAE